MNNSPKYSVIIPVYNAEKTLKRCVNSLLDQNYADAEIILVNDGSTDFSGTICGTFAASFRQIIYIDKENGGVSSARNTGLNVASGKYILFVDSDDEVSENYFTQLDMLDSQLEYDFLWFSYRCIGKEKSSVRLLKPSSGESVSQCATVFSNAVCDKTINSPCNKRYKRKIIEDIALRFDEELSIGEDKLFNLQYALACNCYLLSDKVLYTVYVDTEQSLSRGIRKDLSIQFRLLDDKIWESISEHCMTENQRRKYYEAVMFLKLRSVYSEAKRMHEKELGYKTRKNCIRKMCADICNQNIGIPHNLYSCLLGLPVYLKLVPVIDLIGYLLAR